MSPPAPLSLAFLFPGAMSTSLARLLHPTFRPLSASSPPLTLLTCTASRSASTVARASAAGMASLPLPELVRSADIIFSCLPPSAALPLAQEIVSLLPPSSGSTPSARKKPIYVDLNAISPGTVTQMAQVLDGAGVPFVDGCIIGLPAQPEKGKRPIVYLSAREEYAAAMQEVAELVKGGWLVEVMEGAGEGAASALKMAYGGINKGITGLAAVNIMAAAGHSEGTGQALLKELCRSKPELVEVLARTLPDMVPKAYRWVGEMHEIASFLDDSLGAPTSPARDVAKTFEGMAAVFQRVADDLKAQEQGGDVAVLEGWTAQASQALAARKAK